jgi:lipopolysaccharide/colanic/teichoic acid biosynthesis glycosyltransferase
VDAALAAVGLVVTLPLGLVAAALVAAGRDGPIFYAQTRVGQGGVPFRMWKLRTMRLDAEAHGPRWATVADPRRTSAGRLLRRTRLDELPQLVNVIRGEMALVGPRPERPELVETLARAVTGYAGGTGSGPA